jgi:hypothetical protein
MKLSALIIAFLISVNFCVGQSKTFKTLKNKFRHHDGVSHFSASGIFARTALRIAGDHEYRKAVTQLKSIRFITIPKAAFEREDVSVGGLKKLAVSDSFQEMLTVADHDDQVSLFIRPGKKDRFNKYFLVVDDAEEVVVVEIKGQIDPEIIRKNSAISSKQ